MGNIYRSCTRCVMDTTAEEITFDEGGVCSFCHDFDDTVRPVLERTQTEAGRKTLERAVASIRSAGRNRAYDSILGLSGGTDSCYLAYLAVQFGLRPLVIHVDTGWNSPESESNVRNLTSRLALPLEVFVVDWEEMRDVQLSFYKAAVRNCEVPQDHACFAPLYKLAAKHNVRYVLTGGNLASESILPQSWGYNTADLRHLLSIHARYGTTQLHRFPTLTFWQRYVYYPSVRGIREVRLLDLVPYNRSEAKRILAREVGWKDYGAKHYESVLTRFFQGYYLPTKFGIDKRKAHLSSLILSGQITREEALEELKKPAYSSEAQLQEDKAYIAGKLGLSLSEWEEILSLPPRSHDEFPSAKVLFAAKDAIVNLLGLRRRKYRW